MLPRRLEGLGDLQLVVRDAGDVADHEPEALVDVAGVDQIPHPVVLGQGRFDEGEGRDAVGGAVHQDQRWAGARAADRQRGAVAEVTVRSPPLFPSANERRKCFLLGASRTA